MRIHTRVHIYIYIYIYMYIRRRAHVYVMICGVHANMSVKWNWVKLLYKTNTHIYVYTYTCVYIYIYIFMYIRRRVHLYVMICGASSCFDDEVCGQMCSLPFFLNWETQSESCRNSSAVFFKAAAKLHFCVVPSFLQLRRLHNLSGTTKKNKQ